MTKFGRLMPVNCVDNGTGFVKGPTRLKIVGFPNERRTSPILFNFG